MIILGGETTVFTSKGLLLHGSESYNLDAEPAQSKDGLWFAWECDPVFSQWCQAESSVLRIPGEDLVQIEEQLNGNSYDFVLKVTHASSDNKTIGNGQSSTSVKFEINTFEVDSFYIDNFDPEF